MSKPIAIVDRCTAQLPSFLLQVIDAWQRGFPLTARPYELIARESGIDEDELLRALGELTRIAVLSRVGATIRPNTITTSMLAAMRVPSDRLDDVAAIVNAEPGVNHNYEREHAFNLWFVIAAPDSSRLSQAVERIRTKTDLDVLELPLERSYYIDLGFALQSAGPRRSAPTSQHSGNAAPHTACDTPADAPLASIDAIDRRLLAALEHGLPLAQRPYLELAQRAGIDEDAALARIARLIATGVITRFGFIVRHRRLGYSSNAMCVWNIDDGNVDGVGALFARQDYVTLCYRRPRRLPDWPHNLFCMIHGRDRETVMQQVGMLGALGGPAAQHPTILFSRRCFMQRGTRLGTAMNELGNREGCHA